MVVLKIFNCALLAPAMGWPPLCHWYDKASVPRAPTANSASLPATTVKAPGCETMLGASMAALTNTATGWLAVLRAALLASTRYCTPSSARLITGVV